ncbi:HNH endonuclease [Streptomyces sp. Ag109_G2-6]|uniref:HNH endonuclease signature motif containing protein n=1 Tax=Streptomyces TaxID=1883 RepID=UPI0009A50094|nr:MULTISPECIES: HNH endonuclease signature motif containing protein [Streptomyces]RPF40805.1 HNH endonuclease [Streptomyces sp. Ag109_G2-6]
MPVSPYTKERLAEAAGSSRTLSEALERLGVDPRGGSRRYVRNRMRKLGIEISHFEKEGVKWTAEVLTEAVAVSSNMCEVLRRLGLDVVGGHHTYISRRVRSLAIDTSHFKIPSPAGRPKTRRAPETLLVVQEPGSARRIPGDRLKRAMGSCGVPERCSRCGTEAMWRGYPLPLEVDHIDGDWRNNQLANLRLLCPNCHSTTDSYRGRAKRRAA